MRLRRELVAVLAIALAGTLLRFYRLGALSFGGDEELTALATLALLDGWPPTLPGGLVYLRALSFTALEAVAAAIGGTQEGVFRVVPVLFAFPRIVGVWWLARAFISAPLALACAALLAVAPFDIEYSRMARMYSPFAALDLLFVASLAHLSLNSPGGLRAALFGIASASVHTLTVVHAPLAWLGALGAGVQRAARVRLLVVGAVVVLAFLLFDQVERIAYAPMGLGKGSGSILPAAMREHMDRLGLASGPLAAKIALAVAAAVSAALVARSLKRLTNAWARLLAGTAGLAFFVASPVLAGTALIASFILETLRPPTDTQASPLGQLFRHPLMKCLAAGGLLTGLWVMLGVANHPAEESPLRAAASMVLGFPAPNWLDFVRASPALAVVAALGILAGAWAGARDPRTAPAWLILIAAAIAPALATGVVTRSEALRFQVHAFAPILVLGVYGAWSCLRRFRMSWSVSVAAAFVLALAIVRPDRGIAILLRDHGPTSEAFASFEVAPDHQQAGQFVFRHAAPEDLIVAEDSTQQAYYVGHVDYWLRRQQNAAAFVANEAERKGLFDIYTGARLLTDFDALLQLSASQPDRVIWFITSAEADLRERFYRTPDTSEALAQIKPLARFVGRDGMTRVYRIRAGSVEPATEKAAPEYP